MSRPSRFTIVEADPIPIIQYTGWDPGLVGMGEKISLPLGFDPLIIQHLASHYTDYANLVHHL